MLGSAEVILHGRRLGAFNALRLQRFLAAIVLEPGLQHRSSLAYKLWPDSSERQARTNLRKLLHDLRNALPRCDEFLEISPEAVRWNGAAGSEVDVLSFRDAVATGDYELAAHYYTGDLLPACYDDWVLEERAKLRDEAQAVLTRLARDSAARNDHEATVRHARRLTDLEPTDEAAVQVLMQAHDALGNRAAALRCYHRFTEKLEQDLGVSPGVEILSVYEAIRGRGIRQDQADSCEEILVSESPFVGRESEWKRLVEAWDTVRSGGAHFVLISGEPGIGKSRLASELDRRVRSQGHLVASARAYEAAGRLPWGPVVDLLRSDAFHGRLKTLETGWKLELGRLLPELLDDPPPSDFSISNDPVQRHRLFDAANRAVTTDGRPCLLIMDDLQWCDRETIEFIGFVVHAGKSAHVLVVGTVRPEEVHPEHPLNELIKALERDQAVSEILLDRFDEPTTTTLASQLRPRNRMDPELAHRLWRETEGNPLFIVEALRAGFHRSAGKSVLTPTMRAVLTSRFSQVSEPARKLCEVAAVVGRPFTIDLLRAAMGSDDGEFVDQVDELWRHRIIRDQGSSYDFSHDKLRAVALEMIGPARRRQIHRSIAEAIAARREKDTYISSPQLAAHYDQAGMVGPAIEAYREAGASAVAVSSPNEAVSMYQRAISLLSELPPSPERDAIELDIRIALGSPLVAVQGYGSPASHKLYERAHSLCRKLQRAVDPPILRGLGLARLQGCRFEESDRFARLLLNSEERDAITRTEGRYLLGVGAFWRGELAEARRFLCGAIEAYDPSRRDEHLALYAQDPKAICLVRLALVEFWAGDGAAADEYAQAAHRIAFDLDHVMTQAYVLTYASILAAEAEEFDRLSALLRDAREVWDRLSDRYLIVVVDALRAWLEIRNGEADSIEEIVASVTRSRIPGESLHLTYTLLLLARARGMTGEYHQGRVAIREALSWVENHNQRYLEAELWRTEGELAYRMGESEAAAAALRNAAEIAAAQGAGRLEQRALRSMQSRFPDQGRVGKERFRNA